MESAASCCCCCCCAAPGGCWATASSSEAIVDSFSASTVCLLSWCRPPVSGVGGSWRSSFPAPLEGGLGLVGVRCAGGLRLGWPEVDFELSIFVVFVVGALAGSAGCDDDVRHGNSDGGDSPPYKSRCFRVIMCKHLAPHTVRPSRYGTRGPRCVSLSRRGWNTVTRQLQL